MIKLDFSNVEELIFLNEQVKQLLPSFFANYFESWKLGKRIPALKQMAKQAMYDLINNLNEDHVLILEQFFNERIIVEKLNYNIVSNIKIPLNDLNICNHLCNIIEDNYYSMWRDDENLYISFWR